MKRLLILIPAYNEAVNLPPVLKALDQCRLKIKSLGWQVNILVINDGSADQTANVAKSFNVDVLSHPVNLGYGAALNSGFKYALQHDFDAAISIDADGQHQPEDILKMLKVFTSENVDVVLGSRFVEDTGYKTHWTRLAGIKLFSCMLRLLSGKSIKDVTTGFQLVNKNIIRLFAEEYPVDYPDTQVLLLLSLAGFSIKEIPVKVFAREHGQSMHSSIGALLYPLRNFLAIIVTMLRIAHIKNLIKLGEI